jgi:hypothetical protein
MKKIMNNITKTILSVVIFLCGFFICQNTFAACTGSSPSWTTTADAASVATCVSNATAGDTITFPAYGSATWSSTVTIGKALTIKGNGTTLTSSGSMPNGFFEITGSDASFGTTLMRITGFNFTGVSLANGPRYMIYVHNISLAKLRIDHNTFKWGTTQLEIEGAYGVIDNNNFYDAANNMILTSAGTRAQADASWVSLTPGTANALFVETNKFIIDADGTTGGEPVDAFQGGKLVYRYNEWDYSAAPDSNQTTYIGFHGSANGGGGEQGYWQACPECRRSPSVFEIYNNYMHGKNGNRLFTTRGGSGLIYNNVLTSNAGLSGVVFNEEESYVTSNWPISRTSWPAEDQVHNTFIWGNTFNGSKTQLIANLNTTFIQQDRDYFLHAPCGASDTVDAYGNTCTHGKATFTGANGASDSYPTDGNTYPTEGTMVFTSTGDNAYYGYTPYAYPHPLRGEGGSETTTVSLSGGTVSGGSIQ